MAERDGLERRARSFDANHGLEPLILERAVDGAQPLRPLGMPGRRLVLEASRVGNEKRRHSTHLPVRPAGRKPAPPSHSSQRWPLTLTPGGGGGSAGTKNVGASGSRVSTRYFSKSVTPSPARKLSSIRKLPVKLFAGFWKM